MALSLGAFASSGSVAAEAPATGACKAPEPVCSVRASVFRIAAFDPHGSAVRVAPDLLVTNRHIVADESMVKVHLADGTQVEGKVVPTSFEGDLVLVRAALPDGPAAVFADAVDGELYTVAQDISTRRIRVFPKGRLLLAPDPGKPYARMHHTAYHQSGTSGGAVVDAEGRLVGIATSGGAGRFEAVPVAQIGALKTASGPGHGARSAEIGAAYRQCAVLVEKAIRSNDVLPANIAREITTACRSSGNRQFFDLAAQALGRSRKFDESAAFFELSLAKDPNAINARVGYVVTLSFARRHRQAVPHVRWLLAVLPAEPAVHRYAVQVGKFAGDEELAAKGLALIAKYDPARLEAAKRFVESPLPSRQRPRRPR